MKVTAEVFSLKNIPILNENLCTKVQGFLFSPPIPSDEFENYLKIKILN